MCGDHRHETHGPPGGEDQYVLDTPAVRGFVAAVRTAIAAADSPAAACELIRPDFAGLLADPGWLPERYQEAAAESGMGGGIGQWLLFRAGDGSLSLFSLVVPPEAQTPVHDHLAWGFVGLYAGTQDEEVYAPETLALNERRALAPGDFYALIPPANDIHRVRTTSPTTSVSIHLLTSDTGCTWRHTFEARDGRRGALPLRLRERAVRARGAVGRERLRRRRGRSDAPRRGRLRPSQRSPPSAR